MLRPCATPSSAACSARRSGRGGGRAAPRRRTARARRRARRSADDPADRADRQDDRPLRPRRGRPAQVDARRDPSAAEPRRRRSRWRGRWSHSGRRTAASRAARGVVAALRLDRLLLIVRPRGRRAHLAQTSAPRERVLIVGSARAREQLAHSLASDPGAHLEVVGFLPLEDERRSAVDWGTRSRRKRTWASTTSRRSSRELDVHRVFLIPTTADNETMLDAVSRTTALGVKVSIVPRLFEVVGSSVEFDTVGGVTVLGVRRTGLSRSSRRSSAGWTCSARRSGCSCSPRSGRVVALAIKLDSPRARVLPPAARRTGRPDVLDDQVPQHGRRRRGAAGRARSRSTRPTACSSSATIHA